MTATAEATLRIVAFGDPDASVWGAVLDAGEPAVAFGVQGGHGSAAGADAVGLAASDGDDGDDGDGGFSVESDACRLVVTPAGGNGATTGERAAATDELCRVRGMLIVAGVEHEIDCRGVLGSDQFVDVHGLDSIRGVWGWFADDQALSLLAIRPRRHTAQEDDELTASLFSDEGTIVVDEPRLSTTYGADGHVTSAGLELWIGEGEAQYPRRAAGEALGPPAQTTSEGFTLEISPLRCHHRGLDGAGIYLIARF